MAKANSILLFLALPFLAAVGGFVYAFVYSPLWLRILLGIVAVLMLAVVALVAVLATRFSQQKADALAKVNGYFSLPW